MRAVPDIGPFEIRGVSLWAQTLSPSGEKCERTFPVVHYKNKRGIFDLTTKCPLTQVCGIEGKNFKQLLSKP